MRDPELKRLKQALREAGVEIYRTRPKEIQIAERVRLHIMDSGIRVWLPPEGASAPPGAAKVSFTARSQRSDRPSASAEEHIERVREVVGARARDRGYEELEVRETDVRDPIDDSKILDVWHEVSYQRSVAGDPELIEELRWALGVEKFVSHSS